MCGIFCYTGTKDALSLCMEGILALEYRGYDSSGLAAIQQDGSLFICKKAGKIELLQKALSKFSITTHTAIAHTRWATHGAATENNAHPHTDSSGRLALVHNGVIENYEELKRKLIEKYGPIFTSQTDTEVACHLIASKLDREKHGQAGIQGDFPLLQACIEAFLELKGSFAITLIHKDFPSEMIAVAHMSPLAVAVDPKTNDVFIASDPQAFLEKKLEVVFLQDGEIAFICKGSSPVFFSRDGIKIEKRAVEYREEKKNYTKGIFPHFMLKEIFEQQAMLAEIINRGSAYPDCFAALKELGKDLRSIKQIIILACGSSYHAGSIAAYFIQEIAKIDCRVEIASEYRYDAHPAQDNRLIIALSQSGETADTLACVRECKREGLSVISVCNVEGSSLARISDATLFISAGPEKAVASTKTFTGQLCILFLFTLYLARTKGSIDENEGKNFYEELKKIPSAIADILEDHRKIEALAQKYAPYHDFYFLGRGVLFPCALEAALKLKEIAYKNAVGYPAGEMKHGPIALLDATVPTVVFCASMRLERKIISNLRESKARQSPIIVFGWKHLSSDFAPYCDDIFFIPPSIDILSPILVTVATQLFAYYIANKLGLDIDKPRNLAKSVTVE